MPLSIALEGAPLASCQPNATRYIRVTGENGWQVTLYAPTGTDVTGKTGSGTTALIGAAGYVLISVAVMNAAGDPVEWRARRGTLEYSNYLIPCPVAKLAEAQGITINGSSGTDHVLAQGADIDVDFTLKNLLKNWPHSYRARLVVSGSSSELDGKDQDLAGSQYTAGSAVMSLLASMGGSDVSVVLEVVDLNTGSVVDSHTFNLSLPAPPPPPPPPEPVPEPEVTVTPEPEPEPSPVLDIIKPPEPPSKVAPPPVEVPILPPWLGGPRPDAKPPAMPALPGGAPVSLPGSPVAPPGRLPGVPIQPAPPREHWVESLADVVLLPLSPFQALLRWLGWT